jgi:signal transduction histidine kinase
VEIECRLPDGDDVLETLVRDRGPGVPAPMLKAIFEPFTRLPGHDAIQGAGLGLTIARRAIEMHGGRVVASSRDGGGLDILLILPRRQDP